MENCLSWGGLRSITWTATEIGKGADVKAKDIDGATPLHFAAEYNQNPDVIAVLARLPAAIMALANAGADTNIKDNNGDVALMLALGKKYSAEVNRLSSESRRGCKEHRRRGSAGFRPPIVKAGADINAKDPNGATPLMYATNSGNAEPIVTAFLKAGADAKVKDNAGKTALDYAQANSKLKGTMPFVVFRRHPGSRLLALSACLQELNAGLDALGFGNHRHDAICLIMCSTIYC